MLPSSFGSSISGGSGANSSQQSISQPQQPQPAEYNSDDDEKTPSLTAEELRQQEITSTLRFFTRIPFFSTTPHRVLSELAACATAYTTQRDEIIIQQGAPCDDGLFFIRSGEFKVVKELPVYAPEDKAKKHFNLPTLTRRGMEAQFAQQQQQQQQRQQHSRSTLADSHTASNTSIHSTTTFITNEVHRQQQTDRHQHQQHDSHPSNAKRKNRPLNGSHSMAAIRESDHHVPASSASAVPSAQQPDSTVSYTLQGYSELDEYDASSESPRLHHSADASSTQPILIGSRFLEIGVLGPYSVFGECGVMLRVPRTASVISLSGGSKLLSITSFDFLRHMTKKSLNALRKSSASYPTNDELMLEYDDTKQWNVYKKYLADLAAEKTNKNGGGGGSKVNQMPVFESIPVNPFAIRLPMLRGVEENHVATSSPKSSNTPRKSRTNAKSNTSSSSTLASSTSATSTAITERPRFRVHSRNPSFAPSVNIRPVQQ